MVSVGPAVGILGIILLMAMESSIFPVPSEIVIPPAAFLAMEGKLNMFGVIAAGTFGSWLGATATYWAASVAWTRLHRSVGALFSAQRA